MMEEKETVLKKDVFKEIMNKFYKTAKVLYIICLTAAPISVVLGVILGVNKVIDGRTTGETIISFSVLALYALALAGLLLNAEMLFKNMSESGSPFCEKAGRYITKTARYIFILSVVPALIGNVAIGILNTSSGLESELRFKFGYTGILAGVITLFLSMVFDYGYELQQKADEKEK